MSKGPGKWQRVILEVVAAEGFCVVDDLLPPRAKRSDHSAINRAAHLLKNAGKVELALEQRQSKSLNAYGRPKEPRTLVACQPGTKAPIQRGGKWIPYQEYMQQLREQFQNSYGIDSEDMFKTPGGGRPPANVEVAAGGTQPPHL